MSNHGNLFIITAPSGAGKTSLVKALVESDAELAVSVSHTTRAKRPGEVDGVNYHFVSRESFLAEDAAGEFFESAEVFGNLYGTAETAVAEQRSAGIDVILEIDWQGARQVKARVADACWIFILPPSLNTLARRLRDRAQDDADTIAARLAGARAEMAHVHEADYIVLNDDFSVALGDLRSIISCQRLSASRQQQHLKATLDDLLIG